MEWGRFSHKEVRYVKRDNKKALVGVMCMEFTLFVEIYGCTMYTPNQNF